MKYAFRKSLIFGAALIVAAALSTVNAVADPNNILYTSLGPNGQFYNNGIFISGSGFSNSVYGFQFTTPGQANMTNVQLPLSTWQSQDNNPISLYLEAGTGGDGGQPQTIITQLTQVGSIPSQPGLVTFTCSQNCTLQANTAYWIVAVQTDPNSQDVWWWAYNNPWGYGATNSSGSPTGPWNLIYGPVSGFQVNGVYITRCTNCSTR